MLIHLVADYGVADLAFAEVQQRFALDVPQAVVVPTGVSPFDTLAAGFCLAQLALTPGPAGRVIVHNVAPRRDERGPRSENAGEPFCALRTHEDVLVVGPDAGYSLSFLAQHASSAHHLPVPAAGSQFRSRDFLPGAVAALVSGRRGALGTPMDLSDVPGVPEHVVAYVDGYGNLKTTWTVPPAPPGHRVLVRIGDFAATAVVGDGTFAVAEGELAFAPGSSGWRGLDGTTTTFYELLLRGGSAAERFGRPNRGMKVEVGG